MDRINTITNNDRRAAWLPELMQFSKPHHGKAAWQLVNTLIPYVGLWILIVLLLSGGYSYWYAFALMVPAALLLVRIFIFFHDCCHGSFFRSKRLNTLVGNLTGILTFTPFAEWRYAHNLHHVSAGDLDRRGAGDVWTLTTEEYRSMGRSGRLGYRLVRNPFVMLVLGPIFIFLISQRYRSPWSRKKEIHSIWFTNLSLAVVILALGSMIGFVNYLIIQIPIMIMAGALGIWMFYVQHQYEGVYWARHDDWDAFRAALEGSSFYSLPGILRWFSGNIGYHHIHHLNARIPNYNLQKSFRSVSALREIKPLTLLQSFSCIRLKLWDEEQQKLIGFAAAKS